METDRPEAADGAATAAGAAIERRERSTIEFPYMDLSTALDVARAAYDRNGSADCQIDELAAQLNLSPSSSGFRTRIAAARVFGLINAARGSDLVSLTDLGLRAVSSDTARKARVDAFLSVELFRRVYDEFKGRSLPPAAALQRQMETFGVAPKQTERARQILERSAETAGFHENGRDRLVRPAGLGQEREAIPDKAQTTEEPVRGGGGGGGDDSDVDPIIQGLLKRLPPSGAVWPSDKRRLWLTLLENSFELIYEEPVRAPPQPTHQRRESNPVDDIL